MSSEVLLQTVLPTAVITALLVAAVLYLTASLYYNRVLKPQIERVTENLADEVELGVTRAIDKQLPALKEKVVEAFIDTVTEMPNVPAQLAQDVIRDSLERFDWLNFIRDEREKSDD